MADVFSVVALLIMFREALEAAIIVSIMLQMCDRLKLQPMKKVGAFLVLCVPVAGCFVRLTHVFEVQFGPELWPVAV